VQLLLSALKARSQLLQALSIRLTALIVLSYCPARGDTPAATIAGIVTEGSGAAIPAAKITAREKSTGAQQGTSTNQSGVYQLIGLHSGQYEIFATAPHFATLKREEITVQVGDKLRLDLPLSLGGAQETVTVTEDVPLTQTDSSAVSTVVNERAVQGLPSDGRQLQNLALIVPGVDAGWNLSTAANRYGKARENTEGAFSVNGTRSRSNNFLFDGMPTNLRQ